MAASSDGKAEVSIRCDFSHLQGCCGQSKHYSSIHLENVYQCTKDTTTHFQSLHCTDASLTLSNSQFQEGLLILYRSGIFSIDRASLNLSICPWHRDFFGIYWRDNSAKCKFKEHPAGSKAKAVRGTTPTQSKEYWLLKRELIPIGSGLCKQCFTKIRQTVDDGGIKVDSKEDVDLYQSVQIKMACDINVDAEKVRVENESDRDESQTLDADSQTSMFTTSTHFSQSSASDWEADNMSDREKLNRALHILSNGKHPPFKNQLNLAWDEASKSTKAFYTKLSSEIINLVLSYIVPGQVDKVFASVVEKRKTDETQSILQLDVMTEALIKAYLDQNSHHTQLQILSLFAHKFTKQKLLTLIPGVTMSKIDAARKHANLEKPGQMLNTPRIYRMRLSQPQLMHFVEFISSPMYHQAVGYGSKTLQLSSGLEMTIPKVVRNIITSRLITCYTAYCKDQGYETFSRSTLYNILNCCVASLKKNLHGLDNITADGMKAVENITDVISRLQTFGLEEEKADKLRQMIYSANQHLKFEMKGHLSSESTCIDHCTVHSLSDASSVNFRANCNHEHTDGCNNCCLVNNFFHQIETTFKSLVSLPTDVIDEFDHDINRAKDQILSWKAHCYRTVHQDRAKTEVLRNLQDNQALVVMDWAMKLLPIKHREAQSDFFGKKGISWHISSLIMSGDSSDLNVYTFVHVLELGNQGWFSVAHIISDLLLQISIIHPNISELILKSDNAGCYHCIPLISYIHNLNLHGNMDIKISQYNFSEAQSGKDICDAKTAHCKMHILRYTGEGHDVLTPEDMITALNSNGGVKGVFASVIAVDQKYEIKTKAKIPNISSMNNFEFQAYGVVVRRAYQIGKGQCYQLDKTIPVPLKGFKMVVPFPEFVEEHHGKVAALKESVDMNENNNQNSNVTENMLENENCDGLFACPEQSCVKEYTHPRFLESHICRGNHVYSKNENSYDKVKKIWSEKCIAVDRQYKVLVKSVSSEVSETKEGWALKTSRPCKRFTKKVKDYLYNIYLNCGTTGKRPNFDRLSIELKMQRIENGTKMFSREEWLSPSQIRSLFANYVKLGSPVLIKPEIIEDDEEIYNVLQEIETLEYHNGISELVTTIGSQFERTNNVNDRKPFRIETISNTENVELCADGRGNRDNGLYLNVAKVSTSAPENIKPSTVPILAGDSEYYNLSDVQSSCLRVEELKQYIEKKQRNEELKNEYKSIPNVAVHPTTHAQTKDNMPKNRFKTTFPYDHTRVILESNGGSDYINANYVDGFEKDKNYIACQGPIKATVADHWKMIWQENVYQIVMLTNLVEGIKIKCEQYWPSGGKQMVHGNLIIRLNVEKERTAYVTRELTIEDKKTSKKRKVTQYHFTAWPDHGTPDPLYLVLFHRHVISEIKSGHSGPLLVHCSAGIGRTGTYIALDALLEEGRTTGFLDIFKYLKKMRYSRMNMIQTANQYVCLHYTLLEAFTMKDTKIRKDKFSEVWMSISTDNRPVNHQRLDEEFKDLQQHVREIKGLSSSMLNAKKDEQNQTQHNAAMSTTNLAKNRNKDVLPMDDKRVYLVSYGKGRSDYINAVQVPSYTKCVGYITTQLPLQDTKVDFWTMIRDQSSSTIVLIINNKNEADLVYSQSEDNVTIGEFNIKISARRVEENDITEATIVLSKKDDKPRAIVLFQVICKSIPDPAVLCKLADLISTHATMSNGPITVVSSDGAKNCGLFCAFTNAVSSMQIDNNADIFQLVRLLQLRRPEFFTDFEEYKSCYEALHVHLESANVYANF